MPSREFRTIVLVAYFSGPAGSKKLRYLEGVDEPLQRRGYRLLLINQNGQALDTTCANETLPEGMAEGKLELTPELRRAWEQSSTLQQGVNTDVAHFHIDIELAARRCFLTADFVRGILVREKAAQCILWHQFNGTNIALREYCNDLNIPVLYAHLGPLPGTITFEPGGQMAESWICTENERFNNLPLGEADLDCARAYLDLVKESQSDRKIQTTDWSIEEYIKRRHARGESILFYAGQNDYRSGMAPTLASARLHSPHFEDTDAALNALGEVAAAHNWGILYKPHPNVRIQVNDTKGEAESPIDALPGANVFECILQTDVTVTILSTTSYLSLIQGKPVVQLGCSPLTGKGCVYEIDSRSDIESTIERAINDGFTNAQQKNWLQHVALLIRYYLFAYDSVAAQHIGRGTDVAAEYLIEQCSP